MNNEDAERCGGDEATDNVPITTGSELIPAVFTSLEEVRVLLGAVAARAYQNNQQMLAAVERSAALAVCGNACPSGAVIDSDLIYVDPAINPALPELPTTAESSAQASNEGVA